MRPQKVYGDRIDLQEDMNKFNKKIDILFEAEKKKSFTADEAKKIGEELGINWDNSPFDVEEFRKGLDIELEHGTVSPQTNITDNDSLMTAKITLAHLNEIPDYNTRLLKLEQEAKKGK